MNIVRRRFSLIRRYVLGVVLLVPLCFAPGAQTQATVVNFNGAGDVTSIDDLVVTGVGEFNVDFQVGSYSSVFGTASFSGTDAVAIRDLINVFLNPFGSFSFLSDATFIAPAPTFVSTAGYSIPFGTTFPSSGGIPPFSVRFVQGDRTLTDLGTIFGFKQRWGAGAGGFVEIDVTHIWAVPTLVSAVPLPAALPLFGSALAMLGIVGWRRKRRGDA